VGLLAARACCREIDVTCFSYQPNSATRFSSVVRQFTQLNTRRTMPESAQVIYAVSNGRADPDNKRSGCRRFVVAIAPFGFSTWLRRDTVCELLGAVFKWRCCVAFNSLERHLSWTCFLRSFRWYS
jgi:hypothetical protein